MRPHTAHNRGVDTGLLAVVLAALGASTLVLVALRDGETVMFAVSFGGILAAALLGLPHRPLATLGIVVGAIIWGLLIVPFPSPRATSTAAHVAAAALAAWVLSEPIRHRFRWARGPMLSKGWFTIPLLVLAVAGIWEVGELMGDLALDGDLSLGRRDTSADLAAGLLGAVAGLAARDWLKRDRVEGSSSEAPVRREPEAG